jgi:hypothetical protein
MTLILKIEAGRKSIVKFLPLEESIFHLKRCSLLEITEVNLKATIEIFLVNSLCAAVPNFLF